MAKHTRDFFATLMRQQWYPELRGVTRTGRFVIAGAGIWHLAIQDGALTVTENDLPAATTITCDRTVFDRVVQGQDNILVMGMQNQLHIAGELAFVAILERLLPTQAAASLPAAAPLPPHPAAAAQPVTRSEVTTAGSSDEKKPTACVLEGNTFVISDQSGNFDATPTTMHGLFAWDTRFLSRWKLTIDGSVPHSLSIDDLEYYAVQFFLAPATGTVYADATLSIIRTREVSTGFRETITILNHAAEAVDLAVQMEVGADFADAFEVKDDLPKRGIYDQRIDGNHLILGYQREQFRRETRIDTDASAYIDTQSISYHIHIAAHSQWTTHLTVCTTKIGIAETGAPIGVSKTAKRQDLQTWIANAPKVTCQWEPLAQIYQQSLTDLAALRFYVTLLSDRAQPAALPAAGLPWFMAIFGRDSILTSLQTLPFTPDLAVTTLRALAVRQGCKIDDFRDEEPGKILHELRFGELVAFGERPQSPYYGAADATPLFLILLDEVERWTGNTALVQQLEGAARAALNWITHYGDRNGTGYVAYQRRNTTTGLENQCWKDSWNAILFADGTMSQLPRATCEIQGYVYDAKRRCARLARAIWHDPALADRLEHEADDLKARFNRDFWIAERGYYALALDGEGRQVDALTSNIGHLLWSGIADDDKAASCVSHLMGERLFSGWGVRTMAEGDGGYNPIGYHVGTVWPHDNALIALGLTRYGYRHEAGQIAMGILEAAPYFHHRLPEAMAGYPRTMTEYPVVYPTACSPQAWATGAPLQLLQAVLGVAPEAERLQVRPALPEKLGGLDVIAIPGRWGLQDVHVQADQRTAKEDMWREKSNRSENVREHD